MAIDIKVVGKKGYYEISEKMLTRMYSSGIGVELDGIKYFMRKGKEAKRQRWIR